MNSFNFHETLKNAINIHDEIAARIALQRKGRDAIALCPFHNDRKPSLSISTSKQIYKCFSCGNGGDVVKFVMEYDKISYKEAIKKLANKYNIPLPNTFSLASETYVDPYKKVKALNALAQQFYHAYLLKHKNAKYARSYLSSRGFSKNAIMAFKIGYAAPKSLYALSFAAYLSKKKIFDEDTILKSGLFLNNTAHNYVKQPAIQDFFFDRIIFPIISEKNETLGFAGRAISNTTVPKYLNSRDNAWFKKSEVLYGLHENLQQIGKTPVHIVEGYTDVIAAKMQGITAVAGMGTSLTELQIKKLKRYAHETPMRLMFDSDEAGKKAVLSASFKMLQQNVNAYVSSLPSGEDPFDFFAKTPSKKIENTLQKTTHDIFTFLINHFRPSSESSPFEKKEALKNILIYFREVKNKIVRAEFAQSIEQAFGHAAEKALNELQAEMPPRYANEYRALPSPIKQTGQTYQLTQLHINKKPDEHALSQQKFSDIIKLNFKERSFMFFLCHFPKYISNASSVIPLENISDKVAKHLYERLLLLRGKDNPTTMHILDLLENEEVHNIVIEELEKNKAKYEIKANLQLLSRLTQLKINYAQEKQEKLKTTIQEMEKNETTFTFNSETYKKIQNEAHHIVLEIEKLKQYISSNQLVNPLP